MGSHGRAGDFGGTVGRVLGDSCSVGTLITGVVLGGFIAAEWYMLRLAGLSPLAPLLAHVILAIALARFAVNGLSGESSGTLFSEAGGSWDMVLIVAGRYLALNLTWMLPLVLVAWYAVVSALSASAGGAGAGAAGGAADIPASGPADGADGGAMSGAGNGAPAARLLMSPMLALLTSKPLLVSAALFLLCLVFLPPLFLIVSVRASRFADLFAAPLWRATFSGRSADLFAIYAIYTGGIGMMVVCLLPVVVLGFAADFNIGYFLEGAALVFVAGLAVALLGRLCGFFAFGEEAGEPVARVEPVPQEDAPPAPIAPANVVRHPSSPVAAMPARAAAPTPTVTPGPPPAGARPTPPAATRAASAQVAAPVATPATPPPAASAAAPATAPTAEPPAAPDGPVRPPLPDGAGRAAAAREKFASDPDGAIRDLSEINESHAEDPEILLALGHCLQGAGRTAEAVEVARRALPLGLEHGHVAPAAELFAALWKSARDLGLERDQIVALATALLKGGNSVRATSAFGLALTMDPGDRKAIKGLLQIADQRMHAEGRPKDAARIYTFLLQYASASPFAEDMRRGLAEAESRLARAS